MMKKIRNRNKIKPLSVLVLSLLWLSGCQNIHPQQTLTINQTSHQQHQQHLSQLEHWQIKGKLIFKGPDDKFSASLNWQQKQQTSDIRVTTFLGISLFKMRNNDNSAMLTYDGKTVHSNSPESLLYQTTHIHLPVNKLPLWMKGAISDNVSGVSNINQSMVLDAAHRIKQITVLDATGQPWQIDYQNYQAVESYQLPQKIRLSGNNISIVIKVSQWDLSPTS